MDSAPSTAVRRGERTFAALLLCAAVAFALWAVSVGWRSRALNGNGFRQTQTAITALFVQRDHDFSLAYPTPVLGKPWSVPFEFPLYQWTVVGVSDATGLSLIKSGRLVSAVCFFLALPAVWLLLGRMGVPWARRAIVLALVLTCPLLLFYARAFLIETMALLFALWFLQAFVAAVEKRSPAWLVAANVAGVGAGLVKVTTFMVYLVPAAAWALWWLGREVRAQTATGGADRAWGGVGRLVGWVAAATAVPFAATYAWIVFSDHTKALNPSSRNLVSSAMHRDNFGTWANRTDPATWAAHWRTFSGEILPPATLLVTLLLVLLFCRGRRLAWVAGCATVFLLAPAVFPVLYAWHEYYFTAVAVLPMVAVGLVLGGLFDAGLPRWRAGTAVLVCVAVQAGSWLTFHKPLQEEEPRGSSDIAEALRWTTGPDDVLVIAGEDWGSITPFYAQRRALMLRRDMEADWPYVQEAFANLAGERVAALLLRGVQRENRPLLERAVAAFGLDPDPVYRWRDALVYVRRDQVATTLAQVAKLSLPEIEIRRGLLAPEADGTITWEYQFMAEKQRRAFDPMGRPPLRYAARYGVAVSNYDGHAVTGAHPTTRIWFAVPPGRREIVLEFALNPAAYAGPAGGARTDGVEFVVAATSGNGRRVLFSRLLNPGDEAADRGWQRESLTAEIRAGEELVLETLPGPANNESCDWAGWGPLTIR